MKGLPSDLNQLCFQLFSKCKYFNDFETLSGFCEGIEELNALSRQVRYATSKNDLVEKNLSTIIHSYHDKYNWILPIFLKKIQERYEILQDPLWREFRDLHSKIIENSSSESLSLRQPDSKLEANPKGEQFYDIVTDQKVLDSARAVACVSTLKKIINYNNSIETVSIETGTGWLVTPNLVITCRHVIESVYPKIPYQRFRRYDNLVQEEIQNQITKKVVLTFDYTQPSKGIEYKVEQLEDDNLDLDYAVLRLGDRNDYPLQKWGYLKLDIDVPLTEQLKLYVIQHRKGKPQQRSVGSFVECVSDTNKNQIFHDAPTEGGTSGAPILNVTNCKLVALHNGEDTNKQYRKATLIRAILSDLKQNNSTLYQEILAVQETHHIKE